MRTKDAFDKEFDAFLKTVEPGDLVLFFFSGHGFGVEADQNNYLLFTDLRSPFTYARSQLNDPERRNAGHRAAAHSLDARVLSARGDSPERRSRRPRSSASSRSAIRKPS